MNDSIFVNRCHTHVVQNTTLFTSLFGMVGSVNQVPIVNTCRKKYGPNMLSCCTQGTVCM